MQSIDTFGISLIGATNRRFQFKIDPNTPLKELLPVAPKDNHAASPTIAKDLAQVPEVQWQAPLSKTLPREEAIKQTAHMIAKINHLNDKNSDGFLAALSRERLDLAGLPFAMGDACRTQGERSRQFALAVAMVRAALGRAATEELIPSATAVVPAPVASSVPHKELLAVVQVASSPPLPAPPTPRPTTNSLPQPPPPVVAAARSSQPQPPPPTGPVTDAVPPPPPLVAVEFAATAQGVFTVGRVSSENFWEQYQAACAQEDKKLSQVDRAHQEMVSLARIAALMQVLAPEAPAIRLGLVKYLSTISHVEASRALARLAIFSAEDEIHRASTDALKVRRERDYTDILLQGLRYPLPDVARRAADALVKLERTDLVRELVDLLDEPDPRAPVVTDVHNKRVPVVREVVRINHHRSCLLCHAPANTGNVAAETLTAAVPVPSEPLLSPGQGYQTSVPDVQVRIDVTYLRQDFSMFQAVADAHPWPEMQRFDFLVRTRVLTEKEAGVYREKLANPEPGRLSPYHRAALAALRELTGRDTAPTPEAWRRLLNLPAKQQRMALAWPGGQT